MMKRLIAFLCSLALAWSVPGAGLPVMANEKTTDEASEIQDASTPNEGVLSIQDLDGTPYSDQGRHTYSWNWANVVYNNIHETETGFERAAYIQSGKYISVESYDASGNLLESRSVVPGLPVYGAVYFGAVKNYVVSGQNNTEEDDSAEVFRIEEYTTDWQLQRTVSLYGENTYEPFYGGSCRLDETDSYLYVYTCHTMYDIGDGYHHQANVIIKIDKSDFTVTDKYVGIMNFSYGYVSHSFNQYIVADGSEIYRFDHGDAAPRAVSWSVISDSGRVYSPVSRGYLMTIGGSYSSNGNVTKAQMGNAVSTSSSVIVCGNSADQSDFDNSTQKNIWVSILDKNTKQSNWKQITSYEEDRNVSVGNPFAVKITDDQILLLWEETVSSGTLVRAALTDGQGNLTSKIYWLDARLSDCEAELFANGKVCWHASNGESVKFYQLDPSGLKGDVLAPVTESHYKETTGGYYILESQSVQFLPVGSTYTATLSEEEYIHLDPETSSSQTITVTEDGASLNYYYNREIIYLNIYDVDENGVPSLYQTLSGRWEGYVQLPQAPERSNGGTFLYWQIGSSRYRAGGYAKLASRGMVAKAAWSDLECSYTVHHMGEDLNGGYTTNLGTTSGSAQLNSQYELNPATSEHFTFNEDLSDSLIQTITEDGMEFYLYYDLDEYTISFWDQDDQGNLSKLSSQTVKYQAPVRLPFLEKEGYELTGWQINGYTYKSGTNYKVTADTQATAVWNKLTAYSEEVWVQDVNGTYQLESKTTKYGKTGDTVTLTSPAREHFSVNSSKSVLSAALQSSGTVLKLYYDRDVHTISYDLAGGSFENGQSSSQSALWNSSVTLASAPARKGYTFAGWSAGGSVYEAGSSWTVSGDAVFTAKWNPSKVSWSTEYWLETASGSYELKQTVTDQAYVESTVYADQKSFDHYSLDLNRSSLSAQVLPEGTVLRLYYSLDTHTVSFDLNGADSSGSDWNAMSAKYGTNITLPKAPSRSGEQFMGWQMDGTLYQPGETYTVLGDCAFSARWKSLSRDNTIRIWMENLDGSWTLSQTKTVVKNKGDVLTIEPESFEGFELDKTKSSSLSVTVPEEGAQFDLYYVRKTYTITYDLAGAVNDGTWNNIQVKYQGSLTLPKAPVKGSDEFQGWMADGELLQPGASITVTKDLTIAAWWKSDVRADYIVNIYLEQTDGTYLMESSSKETGKAGTAVVITAPSFEHYSFNQNKSSALSQVLPESGLIFSLYYDLETISVSFDLGGASSSSSDYAAKQVKYGSSITLPAAPKYEGYTLDGWNVNGQLLQPGQKLTVTQPLTIKASWSKVPVEEKKEVVVTVWYMFMNDAGNYDLSYTRSLKARKGEEVSAQIDTRDGYVLNTSKSTTKGTASEGLILKLYYDRTEDKKEDPGQSVSSVTMHRLYNPNSGEHFYTANNTEKDVLVGLGWKYEGVGWTAPSTSKTPVYRLYNANAGDHHYTSSQAERDALVKLGWKYEGIGWYSDDAKTTPLYRQYNPNAISGSHNYTVSAAEDAALAKLGWTQEGIGWYGL